MQCHETEAEIVGVCEDSNFFGIDLETFYSSTNGDKTHLRSNFFDLEISYMDTVDDIVYENEEVLDDISTGMMGHYKEAIKDELKSYFQL